MRGYSKVDLPNQNVERQNPLEARLQRLEEAVAFSEHNHTQLHEQVLLLLNELRATQKKLAAIERRLDEAANNKPSDGDTDPQGSDSGQQ